MGDAHGNWLATLGSWLAVPVKSLMGPWWEKLIEKKAESVVIRVKLLDAIIAFRVKDYACRVNLHDPDRTSGLKLRVNERLAVLLHETPSIDPAAAPFLTRIEREIELLGIPLSNWVQLACLTECGSVDPGHFITVNFTDDKARQSHATNSIANMQSSFPFTQIFAVEGVGKAKISEEAVSLLREYCSRTAMPETFFSVQGGFDMPNDPMQVLSNSRRLAPNWLPGEVRHA